MSTLAALGQALIIVEVSYPLSMTRQLKTLLGDASHTQLVHSQNTRARNALSTLMFTIISTCEETLGFSTGRFQGWFDEQKHFSSVFEFLMSVLTFISQQTCSFLLPSMTKRINAGSEKPGAGSIHAAILKVGRKEL